MQPIPRGFAEKERQRFWARKQQEHAMAHPHWLEQGFFTRLTQIERWPRSAPEAGTAVRHGAWLVTLVLGAELFDFLGMHSHPCGAWAVVDDFGDLVRVK